MRNIILGLLTVLLCTSLPGCAQAPLNAGAGNVNANLARPAWRLLTKQFATNANIFTLVDPSPAGTPLTETSSTGITDSNGAVTVYLQAGFTAPVTLTLYIWNRDKITTANACWLRCGSQAATGPEQYNAIIDTNYASVTFLVPPYTEYLILSSAAITGKVYISTHASPNNLNSATGYSN